MTLAILFILLAVLLTWYALWGRDWLKSKPWPWVQRFFAWVEPIEIALFKKSQTILFARLKILTGLILTGLTQAGEINLTPFMPFVPEQYQTYVNIAVNCLPMALSLMGCIDEQLRNKTTLPIEVVAVAEKDVTPKVAAAVMLLEDVKVEAVQAAVEAKVA